VHLYLLTHIQLSMKRYGREDQRWAQSGKGIASTACLTVARCGSGATRRDWPAFRLSRARKGNVGGAGRDRTDDPLLAKQVLSQLSYSPGGFED
jgi:hypothetical protein